MASIALIIGGVLLIIFGVVILLKKSSNQIDNLVYPSSGKQEINHIKLDSASLKTDIVRSTLVENNSPVQQNMNEHVSETAIIQKERLEVLTSESSNDSKKKGYDFEKFVVKKFTKEYFKLMEWTSDKYTDGIYAENAKQPDLVYEFTLGDNSHNFAVECKWRKTFYNNEVEIATTQQIKNYKAFEKKRGVPVFVTLGIGGEPSSPKQLYIIPLNKIFSDKVDQSFLKEFEQVPSRNFFFDYKSKSLSTKPVHSLKEQV